MANESSDSLVSREALTIQTRDYMREFIGNQMAILEAKLTAQDALQKQLAESTNRAVEKAEQQMNARLITMNEFREQLQHQAALFATRAQLDDFRDALQKASDERHIAMRDRIEAIDKLIANWQGRLAILGAMWAIVVIFVSALVNYTLRSISASDAQPRPVTIAQPLTAPVPVLPVPAK